MRIALATLVGGLAVAGFAAAAGAFNSGADAPTPAREGAAAIAAPGPAAPAAALNAPSVAALRAAGITRVVRVEREHGDVEVEGLDARGRAVEARLKPTPGAPPTVVRDRDDNDRDSRRGSRAERDDD
jgi:hypothetical protein